MLSKCAYGNTFLWFFKLGGVELQNVNPHILSDNKVTVSTSLFFYEFYPHKVLLEQHYEHSNTQILTYIGDQR